LKVVKNLHRHSSTLFSYNSKADKFRVSGSLPPLKSLKHYDTTFRVKNTNSSFCSKSQSKSKSKDSKSKSPHDLNLPTVTGSSIQLTTNPNFVQTPIEINKQRKKFISHFKNNSSSFSDNLKIRVSSSSNSSIKNLNNGNSPKKVSKFSKIFVPDNQESRNKFSEKLSLNKGGLNLSTLKLKNQKAKIQLKSYLNSSSELRTTSVNRKTTENNREGEIQMKETKEKFIKSHRDREYTPVFNETKYTFIEKPVTSKFAPRVNSVDKNYTKKITTSDIESRNRTYKIRDSGNKNNTPLMSKFKNFTIKKELPGSSNRTQG
jgi:hypothetical protein